MRIGFACKEIIRFLKLVFLLRLPAPITCLLHPDNSLPVSKYRLSYRIFYELNNLLNIYFFVQLLNKTNFKISLARFKFNSLSLR